LASTADLPESAHNVLQDMQQEFPGMRDMEILNYQTGGFADEVYLFGRGSSSLYHLRIRILPQREVAGIEPVKVEQIGLNVRDIATWLSEHPAVWREVRAADFETVRILEFTDNVQCQSKIAKIDPLIANFIRQFLQLAPGSKLTLSDLFFVITDQTHLNRNNLYLYIDIYPKARIKARRISWLPFMGLGLLYVLAVGRKGNDKPVRRKSRLP